MTLNPVVLARMQFAFTVSFHIIFPTISIGLAMFLAIVEGLWLKAYWVFRGKTPQTGWEL